MTSKIVLGDLPLTNGVAKGDGLCRDSNGDLFFDNGKTINGVAGSDVSMPNRRLTTLVIGNSIANHNKLRNLNDITRYARSEITWANWLSGGALVFPEMGTFGTGDAVNTGYYTDKNGIYGHGGATSTTILSEIYAELLLPALQNGVKPDLIWIHSLFENDPINSITYQTSIDNLNKVIALIRGIWPNVLFLVASPRPRFFFNTDGRKQTFIGLKNYVLNLQVSDGLFGYDASTLYENPLDPGTPKYIPVVGSISGLTMVIESLPVGAIIRNKYQVGLPGAGTAPGTIINNLTAHGGVGTYTVDNGAGTSTPSGLSLPSGSVFWVHNCVDGEVHPTGGANYLVAQSASNVIKQIAGTVKPLGQVVSPNLLLAGSVSATGTGIVAGSTLPTNVYISASAATASTTLTALGNGFRISIASPASTGTAFTPCTLALAKGAAGIAWPLSDAGLPNIDAFRLVAKVKVISGCKNVERIAFQVKPDSAAQVQLSSSASTSGLHSALEYADGDEFTIVSDIYRCTGHGASFIATLRAYLDIYMAGECTTSDNPIVEVYSWGYEVIQDNCAIGTLVAGTVTIADTSIKQTSKVSVFRRNGAGTAGLIKESARVAGTSITISSSNAADTSAVSYIVE